MVHVGSYAAVPLVERFVLCAISGASTFAIALASAAQVHIVKRLCRGNFTSKALDLCNVNLESYKKCMRAAIFPMLEMLVFPAIFTLLHMYMALSTAYCILGCMVMMSCTCIALRISGVVSWCTSVKTPVYPGGYPFPTVSTGECGKNNSADSVHMSSGAITSEDSRSSTEHEYVGRMHWAKAFAVALLLIPFRVVSLAFSLVLAATKLVLLPVSLISDIVRAASGMWVVPRENAAGATRGVFFKESSNVVSRVRGLAAAVSYDLAWILSLGIYGAVKIVYASTDVPANSLEAENGKVRSNLSACCKAKSVTRQESIPGAPGNDSGSVTGLVADVESCEVAARSRSHSSDAPLH